VATSGRDLQHSESFEGETEPDPQAGGTDTTAIGTVSETDLQDRWVVTLTLPDEITSGDYGCRIEVYYPEPE